MWEGATWEIAEASERLLGRETTLRRLIRDYFIPVRLVCEGGVSGHRRCATVGHRSNLDGDLSPHNSPSESVRTSMRQRGRNTASAPLGSRPE